MPYIHRVLPDRTVILALIESQHGGNISAAARAAGLPVTTLHDILKGARQGREETLQALADGLGVSLEAITFPREVG